MNTRKFAVFSVLFSLCLLFISHFFQWDNSAILGIDKICSDLIVIVLSLLFIKKFGLLRTAGFNSLNFIKALVLAIPFYIIGISSVFVSNVDFSSLTFISGENLLLFSLQMLLVGANEEIWLRALILNGFLQNDNSTYKTKSILLSSLIFGLIHVPNFFLYGTAGTYLPNNKCNGCRPVVCDDFYYLPKYLGKYFDSWDC